MIVDVKQITPVDILVMADSTESYAIRSILESFGIQTRTHYIGNVRHLISLLKEQDYLYETIIICCHGDKEGLLIPELSTDLEETMPFRKRLNALNLLEILSLNNRLVINTGCCLGNKEFAQSFLASGTRAYIGALDYIEASAMLMFVVNFAYFYFVMKLSIKDAFDKARFHLEDKMDVILWENECKKEIYKSK